MDIIEAIKMRRSRRKYQATLVDDEKVNFVLEAARWAPSWANTQCWRFIVVRDANIKTQLADMLGKNQAAEAVRTAPVVIVACAEKGKSGYYKSPEPSTDKGEYWYMFDVALAMHNLTLAAHSIGLGTVHIGLFNAKEAEKILGVPEGYCVIEMTPLGYPAGEPKITPRKELSEFVYYEKFSG